MRRGFESLYPDQIFEMYRTAPERKTVKIEYKLTDKEVNEAILDFLEKNDKIPEEVEKTKIKISVKSVQERYGGGGPVKNSATISFDQEVLSNT